MNFIDELKADGEKALAFVKGGLTFIEHEGAVVIAWVEKEVPDAAPAIAQFLVRAEDAAAGLAKTAANGMEKQVSAGMDDMQTFLLNLIQSSGLSKNTQAGLASIDASAVALIEGIGIKLVQTALAALLAKMAGGVSNG